LREGPRDGDRTYTAKDLAGLLASILDAAGCVAFLINFDGTILVANSLAADFVGLPEKAVVGDNLFVLLPRCQQREGRRKLDELLASRSAVSYVCGEGDAVLDVSMHPVPGRLEEPAMAAVFLEECGQPVPTPEVEDRVDNALEIAGVAWWEYDAASGRYTASPLLASFLGFEENEAGPTIEDHIGRIHPDDVERYRTALADHMQGRTRSLDVRYRMRCSDGSWRWMLDRGRVLGRDSSGAAVRLGGALRDINEFVKTENERDHLMNELMNARMELEERVVERTGELERTRARLANIIETNIDGMVVVDTEGTILFVNPAAANLLERETDDLLGHLLGLPSDEGAIEVELPLKNGEIITAELRNTPIIWEQKPAILISLRDISERIQAERLRQDVERFTRHDLKSPLNAIINLPIIMSGADNLTPDQEETLRLIMESGYRMMDIINSSVALFKIEQGTYEIHSEEVDLLDILSTILREMELKITTHKARIELLVDGRTPAEDETVPASGEKLLYHTMLANVLTNAVEAADPGETVRIDVSGGEEQARITVSNRRNVPEEIRDSFFHKYVTWGKRNGTGVGTYIARTIARAHGGDVTLETGNGSGTRVTLTLPGVGG
jgi:signal transduction histidine kinase